MKNLTLFNIAFEEDQLLKDLFYVTHIAESMLQEQNKNTPGSRAMVWTYFIQLVVYLSRKYTSQINPNDKSIIRLAETITYIERHYMEDLTLTFLATKALLSVNQFLRIFKQGFNISPIEYVNQLRLRKACELLEKSDLDITRIAYQVGFKDSNYFSRCFRKTLGCTPKEFIMGRYLSNRL